MWTKKQMLDTTQQVTMSRREAADAPSERLAPQPPPKPRAGSVECWPLAVAHLKAREHRVIGLGWMRPSTEVLLADMEARNAQGVAKYGVPLMSRNGRDPVIDAYQEVLDQIVYLSQAIEESESRVRASLLQEALELAFRSADILLCLMDKSEPQNSRDGSRAD